MSPLNKIRLVSEALFVTYEANLNRQEHPKKVTPEGEAAGEP